MYARFDSNVSTSGNTICTSNSATNGGGINAQFNSTVNIVGITTFIGNSATNGSGRICVEYNSSLYISGITTFLGNSARFGGGVGEWFNSDVDIGGNVTLYLVEESVQHPAVWIRIWTVGIPLSALWTLVRTHYLQ